MPTTTTQAAARRASIATTAFALIFPAIAFARSTTSPPPLPAPSGTVVNVSSESQLQAAVQHVASNTTIVIAPGTYVLSSTLYINGTFANVTVRGATNNRDDVVLVGPGMSTASYGGVPYGIWTGGNVQGITIANLTIRDLYYHPIIFNAGTQSPRVYNVHLMNAGQQFIKSNPDGAGGGVNNGIVEYSVIEYTTTAKNDYTNGVDVHTGANWIVRHNLFRNIVAPPGMLAGPAVLIWNHSSNSVVEGNSFLNCARGIAFGLEDVSGNDHSGGIIRNNVFYRSAAQPGDVAIQVADSPNTQVLNNTVLVSGTYPYPIEYRFAGTTGVVIKNNLLDGAVLARDAATGTVQNNVTSATSAMFVSASTGDLHLKSTATAAIDRGVTVAGVIDDWDGEARPIGSAPDVGADEFSGTIAATYAIGGHVRNSSGAAVSGVTVTLSGSSSATQTDDTSGAYNFTNLAGGGNYTITPSKSGVSFTPASWTYSPLAANQSAADFNGAATSTPPAVSLTAPASGATFTAPATIAVAASASSTGSSISKVDFYVGTTLIGTDTTSPYSVSWTVQSAGIYSLTAVARDAAGNTTTSSGMTVTVNGVSGACPCSLWPATATPGRIETGDTSAVELGMRIKADTDGTISGVRFYKAVGSAGPHVGHLWTNTGTLLGTISFSAETASGWQQANFLTPIAVTANTTYVVSYYAPAGQYAADVNYFATGLDKAPLHAPADGGAGANGVYRYGASGFPTSVYQATNYWVDVVLATAP